MKLRVVRFFFCVAMAASLLYGCKQKIVEGPTDTLTSGSINIVVDESFRPVIETQIEQFERLFPEAHIKASYLPEASCLKELFYNDSIRMAIVTRYPTAKEEKFLAGKLEYLPKSDKIANDAVTIIVNTNSSDTLYTKQQLKDLLQGNTKSNKKIVFDGLNTTSTVRYITDSILGGQALDTSIVKAAVNSQAVIDFVASNAEAIGLLGLSWVGNPEKEDQVKMLDKIKIAYMQCEVCDDQPYVKPMQQSIITRRYPLVRGLYFILKENFNGLGSGFSNFLRLEKGQLIFRRSYLSPVMDFDVRKVFIDTSSLGK